MFGIELIPGWLHSFWFCCFGSVAPIRSDLGGQLGCNPLQQVSHLFVHWGTLKVVRSLLQIVPGGLPAALHQLGMGSEVVDHLVGIVLLD